MRNEWHKKNCRRAPSGRPKGLWKVDLAQLQQRSAHNNRCCFCQHVSEYSKAAVTLVYCYYYRCRILAYDLLCSPHINSTSSLLMLTFLLCFLFFFFPLRISHHVVFNYLCILRHHPWWGHHPLPIFFWCRRWKSSQQQPQQDDYFGCSCSCRHWASPLSQDPLRLWLLIFCYLVL